MMNGYRKQFNADKCWLSVNNLNLLLQYILVFFGVCFAKYCKHFKQDLIIMA